MSPPERQTWARWLSDLDSLLYAALGLVLLGAIVFAVGRAVWQSGSTPVVVAFGVALVATAGSALRDLRERRLGWASRGLLAAWALCVAAVVLVEVLA